MGQDPNRVVFHWQAIHRGSFYRGGPIKTAVVGLGTGTFACFSEPGDTFKFYEINASVQKMARDPNYFRYLTECTPNVPIRLGDARLTMAREAQPWLRTR